MVLAVILVAIGVLVVLSELRLGARPLDCGVWSDSVERRLLNGHRCWPIE